MLLFPPFRVCKAQKWVLPGQNILAGRQTFDCSAEKSLLPRAKSVCTCQNIHHEPENPIGGK
ncbi:MAG: hypothetical protein AVDCRST_MAG56-5515 [uncultured Cytophagales bacterium]|uniref:Uncharacterized protein n=1 Tax=uncultured Cytophagales bacterium TaxID=158755 RepID=A0A6J4KEY2_9SPHI|nr:MAG: hypothetical protein AVDCRST_MAG56-5515 [uncultured Cytophagales bacterium]